jgi:glycosyltransferase involved in cell wall biosynthesis
MRCMITVPSLMRSGAETQAVDLANGLSSYGHSVHLFSFEPQLDQKTRLTNNVHFHHILRKRKYDLSVVTALAQIIDREEIEVVQGVLQFATLVSWLAAKKSRRKPPVVAAIHTTVHRNLKSELQDRILYRRLYRRLPAIVFVCQHQRDHWLRRYPELEPLARVVHNGVDPARFRRCEHQEAADSLRLELAIPASSFVFSCLAAFRPEKGHDKLIRAFSRLPDHAYLILAGDGERRRSIEKMVFTAGLAERVRFLGNVADVRPVLVMSDASVLASTAVETFSMAMLESMALGVPMIAPRIGGLSEAILPRQTGLLFPVGDVEALAAGMGELMADPAAARNMGRAAELHVRERFTLERMAKRNERVLLEAGQTANRERA